MFCVKLILFFHREFLGWSIDIIIIILQPVPHAFTHVTVNNKLTTTVYSYC